MRRDLITAAVAVLVAVWAVWVLELSRFGVEITHGYVGETPITEYRSKEAGPPVVIAHGFAGSRQMMQAYALTLARAGYRAVSFDFEGHGAHPVPMSGDVDSIDGTTRLLVEQTRAVMDFVGGDMKIALLGHSMATDILVRVASDDPRTGPLVLLSAFSQAIDAQHPPDLLLIPGAWEAGLKGFALEAVQMVDPQAEFDRTVFGEGIRRRAQPAPMVEHVAILHSLAGQRAALDWLNGSYGKHETVRIPPTGWALLALLAAVTALVRPLSRVLPRRAQTAKPLTLRQFAWVACVPALAAPALAAPVETRLLPVLVADYLALHLALYGVIQLAMLWWMGARLSRPSPLTAAALAAWGIGVFGLLLHRYGAGFMATGLRWPIIAALALGAVPFMLADARAAFLAPLWQRIGLRVALLVSLGIAVALDFAGLFFLLMIAPVIVLFLLTFGLMGRWVARRAGPESAGLALGLVLAWALGVSFPLFSA